MSPPELPPCPPSPGRAITKAAEEPREHRPASLDLGGGVRRPLQYPGGALPQQHNPLIYLQVRLAPTSLT